MTGTAEYFIAQFLADPMRREPRNIGIVVFQGDECSATFLGEVEAAGHVDKRRLKKMPNPDIYERWVRYWREQIQDGGDDVRDRLMGRNGGNYDVIPGGEITDAGDDPPAVICDHLYTLLVAGGEFSDDDTPMAEAETSVRAFRQEILHDLRALDIMAGRMKPDVPHPVYAEIPVLGKKTEHVPAYFQQNGFAYVMETVNFTTLRKNPAKERAGWAARMFEDIVERDARTHTIALIRATPEDLEDKIVKYALDILPDTTQVVNWHDSSDRRSFLSERDKVARTETISESSS